MTIKLAILKETAANERRVAITPTIAEKLLQAPKNEENAPCALQITQGAGELAGIPDAAYPADSLVDSNARAIQDAALILCVQMPDETTLADLP
ncbi:MAG TPA: hypothetical protein VFP95_04090, partial [Gammaproteobacteria bacterium]|nr:hypothetical protein [Gammaproteobacteria bacterium]